LLWIWYALPQVRDIVGNSLLDFSPQIGQFILDIRFEPFVAAVIGFTVAYGAYMTEIFRAGIQSIPKGQMEAARSLGMNYLQAMRFVILPQAVRVILPPLGNEFVTLLKDSSLVSVLAVSDLTRRGREYVARSFLSFDTFTMVAMMYLIMTLFFTRFFVAVERRLSIDKH
jgi:polar amino acid transport system permease protein